MLRFLLDANLSHETAAFLTQLGYDTKTVAQFGLEGAEDYRIAAKAQKTRRILVTLDLDFGEIFYFSSARSLWVIVLHLKDQTVESVHKTLDWLLRTNILSRKEFRNTLLIVEEGRIKIRRKFVQK